MQSTILKFTGKVIASTIIYAVAAIISASFLIMVSLPFPEVAGAEEMLPFMVISAFMLFLFLGGIAGSVKLSFLNHFFVWFAIIFLNSTSVMVEGFYFSTTFSITNLPAILIHQLILSAAASLLIAKLFGKKIDSDTKLVSVSTRDFTAFAKILLIGSVVYLAAYWIFGQINYELFTKDYYAELQTLSIPDTATLIIIEGIRAVIITLSLLPLILLNRDNNLKRRMIIYGSLVFITGGLVPIITQLAIMPAAFVFLSLAEIFLQNFTTGAVVGFVSHKLISK